MQTMKLTAQGLMATSLTKGATEIEQNILRLSKPTDMTIHWKGLGKHFLMVPSVVRFIQFSGNISIIVNALSGFSSKNLRP
jgi:hypothetical protein